MKIEDININQGRGFYVNIRNLKATGASNFRIEKLRINVEQFKVDAIVDIAAIEAIGDYNLEMVLGVLNLKGEGKMKAFVGK